MTQAVIPQPSFPRPLPRYDEENEAQFRRKVQERLAAVSTASSDGLVVSVKEARFGATGDGTTDDTAAIQAAIDLVADADGGIVFVPHGTYIATQIELKTNITLCGEGWASVLQQKASTNAHFIVLADVDVEKTVLRDLKLYGNKSAQSNTNRGIFYDNTAGGPFDIGDAAHTIQNVLVKEFIGDGVHLGALTRETHCIRVIVQACDAYSFNTASTDCKYVLCVSISSGLSGFRCAGASDQYDDCKSFGSGQEETSGNGAGFLIEGDRIYLSLCEAQENWQRGFYLFGCNDCHGAGLIADSNDEHAFRFNGASNNFITGSVVDTSGLLYTHTYGVIFENTSENNTILLSITGTSSGDVDGSIGDNTFHSQGTTHLGADLVVLNRGQLQFPATQNPSAGANTLDDYEEGTWTPSVGGTATYGSNEGTYTKIGRLVHIRGVLRITTIGTGDTGIISGLPFAAAIDTAGTVGNFISLAINVEYLTGYVTSSSTFRLTGLTAAGASTSNPIAVIGDGTRITFAATYHV